MISGCLYVNSNISFSSFTNVAVHQHSGYTSPLPNPEPVASPRPCKRPESTKGIFHVSYYSSPPVPFHLSPTRIEEEVLLQKPTVHQESSRNGRWVVTSQAEWPSAHGGVREIFLSLKLAWRNKLGLTPNSADRKNMCGKVLTGGCCSENFFWGQNEHQGYGMTNVCSVLCKIVSCANVFARMSRDCITKMSQEQSRAVKMKKEVGCLICVD